MKLSEAKLEFIQLWGTLGSQWGINRTMAQLHALLMVNDKPLSTEEVMEQLNISRGNANTNLRELINWTLVKKEFISGERKDFFVAEKDTWEIAKRIVKERKRRELEPILHEIKKIQKETEKNNKSENKAFHKQLKDLHDLVEKMNRMAERLLAAEQNLIFNTLLKML